MAAADDRTSESIAQAADGPSESVVDPAPAAPPYTPLTETPAPYSAVSLLAILGFSVAVVYGAGLTVAALVALLQKTPLLIAWSLLIPAAAAAVCAAAHLRIRNSEGALSGLALTRWGLGVSLVLGLLYVAYFTATYLAVSAQAKAFADQWFDDLAHDRIAEAYLLTLPPPRPTVDDKLRAILELDYNRGAPGKGGLSEFRRQLIVRHIQQGGAAAKVTYLGAQAPAFDKDGYHVDLSYRLESPAATIDVVVTVVGSESRSGDYAGRQWTMKPSRPGGPPTYTAEGTRMLELATRAAKFAGDWIDKQKKAFPDRNGIGGPEDAYLSTLRAADRDGLTKAKDKMRDAPDPSAVIKLRDDDPACKTFLDGFETYQKGSLIVADSKTFWAPDAPKGDKTIREDIIEKARKLFDREPWDADTLQLTGSVPLHFQDADGERFGFDMEIAVKPDYAVEARLFVANDAPFDSAPAWRIHSIELVSAKSAAGGGPSQRPGRTGSPTGPGGLGEPRP
jgi:hypothetical protein